MGVEQGREGRACCCTSLWACRCLSAGAFAGLARVLEPPTCSWSVRACVLCAQCCMCSAMLCSCAFVAWGTLGTGSPVGMRDAGPGFACVRAWGRSARRRVLRHSCVRQCRKVVFSALNEGLIGQIPTPPSSEPRTSGVWTQMTLPHHKNLLNLSTERPTIFLSPSQNVHVAALPDALSRKRLQSA